MSKEDFRVLVNQAMDRRGIRTKKEIAVLADRDASWVSRITTGSFKETPSPEDLAVLHDVLGVPPASLLAALGYDMEEGSNLSPANDYRLIELSEEWPCLSDEERGWILDIVDANKRRREIRNRARAVAEDAEAEYSVNHG